jgi:hypothetical protein
MPPRQSITRARLMNRGAENVMHAWIGGFAAHFAQSAAKIIGVLNCQLLQRLDFEQTKVFACHWPNIS